MVRDLFSYGVNMAPQPLSQTLCQTTQTVSQAKFSFRFERRERERARELSESRVPFAPWPLPRSHTFRTYRPFHSEGRPKVGETGKSIANGEREFGTPPRGRSPNANALVAPDGLLRQLLRQLLRTPTPRCSGPREPGGAEASIARRGRFERPRRALAPARLPRPPSSEGCVGELHAHRDGVCALPPTDRHRGAACAPPECYPNAQESERAKACKARRAH